MNNLVIFPSHVEAYTASVLSANTESAIRESGNIVVTESGFLTPITQEKVVDFVKEESSNLKQVINTLELVYNNIALSETGNQVILSHVNGDKFVVNLESYIKDSIYDYCINSR